MKDMHASTDDHDDEPTDTEAPAPARFALRPVQPVVVLESADYFDLVAQQVRIAGERDLAGATLEIVALDDQGAVLEWEEPEMDDETWEVEINPRLRRLGVSED